MMGIVDVVRGFLRWCNVLEAVHEVQATRETRGKKIVSKQNVQLNIRHLNIGERERLEPKSQETKTIHGQTSTCKGCF